MPYKLAKFSNDNQFKFYKNPYPAPPPPPPSNDPFFNNVVLWLKGNGANGDTNIIDSSLLPKPVTRFGNTQISTVQSKYGGSSIFFNASGDYLEVPITNFRDIWENVDIDVTVEAWIYPSSISANRAIIDSRHGGASGGELRLNATTGQPFFYFTVSTNYAAGNPTFVVNQWQHIAMTRSSRVTRLFCNGILSGTQTTFTVNRSISVSNLRISSLNSIFLGYMDSLRITIGVARYTANFDPENDTYLNE